MCVCKSLMWTFFCVILVTEFAKCTELVPVYMWGNSKIAEHVPALHKINEDSFKDVLLEQLKQDPYLIIFAEQTLSPEDFAQRNHKGETAFPHLSKLRKSTKVTYRPYVQNPIRALKNLDKDVTEISMKELLTKLALLSSNILIIDLNDARDNEHRFDMLKRHDSDIVAAYNELLKEHDNVLAIYTSHHTSWVASEDVTKHRNIRSLLAAEDDNDNDTNKLFIAGKIYLYSGNAIDTSDDKTYPVTWNEGDFNETAMSVTGKTSSGNTFTLSFSLSNGGYWSMDGSSSIYAPKGFSYHCTKQSLKSGDKDFAFPDFQVQPFPRNSNNETGYKFGDAYDCTGFTSVPIWSGLFVTAILLIIMTIGLTMMMDIKTMDRFDDAKGKTISINVSE